VSIPPLQPSDFALLVIPLCPPRRCWLLSEGVGTGDWEVETVDRFEAIGVATMPPGWDGQEWQPMRRQPSLVLTWAPEEHRGLVWTDENEVFWTEGHARDTAQERTRAARAARGADASAESS
jgi:hypothetical protein